MRAIFNAVSDVLRDGIGWQLMPGGFPRWGKVCRWCARLRDDGTGGPSTTTRSHATAPIVRPAQRLRRSIAKA